ncbi:hypothetical protein BDW74DRAFT_189665 [Aspergillus multicolor]|uniref:uncharacterized protein n=1 Tax=Aspergillus multicolor TaxID=41759 RepID=UPI003CCD993B
MCPPVVVPSDSEPRGPSLPGILSRPSIGLTILHDHPNATIDIFVTHGLNGDPFDTFYHAGRDVYWLRDFLKDDFPTARIMVFGYDVDICRLWNQVSQGCISGYAADLLGSLSGCRKNEQTRMRPLLFIAHSLGGLVVQQALVAARESRIEYIREIETHTMGICFLGTPHRGANLATWAERFTRMFNIFRPANHQIVSLLKRQSRALHEMRRSFYNILERRKDEGCRIHIVCFYETIPMVRSLIVSEESATIDGELCFPILANHVDMARFASREDCGYQALVRELQNMISGPRTSHLCPGCRQHWRSN